MQIRHGSLESARLSANRLMLKHAGEKQYKMILRKFPHHVMRENKQATGAGADRVSDGMRAAFGKIVGTAARVQAGERCSPPTATSRTPRTARTRSAARTTRCRRRAASSSTAAKSCSSRKFASALAVADRGVNAYRAANSGVFSPPGGTTAWPRSSASLRGVAVPGARERGEGPRLGVGE